MQKSIKTIYRALIKNDFRALSIPDLIEATGYTVNNLNQIFNRYPEYFSIQGPRGNRNVQITKKHLNDAILLRDNYKCVYCGKGVTSETATIDHVTPVAKGGTEEPNNLATACRACNDKKRNLDVINFVLKNFPKGQQEKIMARIKNITKISTEDSKKIKEMTETELNVLIRRNLREILSHKFEYITVELVQEYHSEMGNSYPYWAWKETDEDEFEWFTDDDGLPDSDIEDVLDYFGNEGWELVSMIPEKNSGYGVITIGDVNSNEVWNFPTHFLCIFKRSRTTKRRSSK